MGSQYADRKNDGKNAMKHLGIEHPFKKMFEHIHNPFANAPTREQQKAEYEAKKQKLILADANNSDNEQNKNSADTLTALSESETPAAEALEATKTEKSETQKQETYTQELPATDYYSKGKIGATLSTYAAIASSGKKIYNEPGGSEKYRLKYGEDVTIYGYQDDWYKIAHHGKLGWVQRAYVKDPMPLEDEQADLHFVKDGERLSTIVQQHYNSINKEYADARLLAFAVASANVGRTGVTINLINGKDSLSWLDKLLLDDTGERALTIWNSIQVKSGTNIWLPSEAKVAQLARKHQISAGSISQSSLDNAFETVAITAAFGFGLIEGILQSVADLFVGIYETGELVVKAIGLLFTPGKLAELFEKLKDIDWGEVWEAVKKSGAKILEDFKGSWNNPNKADAAEFQGKVIGYLAAEILLIFFTGGILTEIK